MGKPTFVESSRMLVRNIWATKFERDKDELTISEELGFVEVKMDNEYIMIHRKEFENYFNAVENHDKRKQEECLNTIQKALKGLISG